MKKYKSVPAVERELDSIVCDKCGREVKAGLEITRLMFSLEPHAHLVNAESVDDFCVPCGEYVSSILKDMTGKEGYSKE